MGGMTQFLQNAVYGTVMIAAVALLRRVLKDRLAPGARLALWAVCLFRLLTPVAPSSVLSLWGLFRQAAPVPEPAAAPSGTGMYLPAPDVNAPAMMAPDTAASSAVEAGIPWKMVLLGVWLAVGAALAARYALSYVRTRRAVGETVLLGRDD
ncbi:MAG: M56 family metallopeptidase, partial [Oscillospiraceae bacterium]|nr:M56 family metallopeptidase [Oscillospiraceae bacterium]